jgi:TatD DNase family protein
MPEPFLIDTHTHVNFDAYKKDRKEVISRSLDNDIWLVNVGSEYGSSAEAVDIADAYDEGVYAVIGLHPVHVSGLEHQDEEEAEHRVGETFFSYDSYRELAKNPKVVGIGECGLEYYRLPPDNEAEIKVRQKEAFGLQIDLAVETKKALIVHSRDAYDDLYDILKSRIDGIRAVIIHSFIGSPEIAKKFVNLGCFISLNGIITYKPRKEKLPGGSDPGLLEAVEYIPLESILLETDAPYLSPEPLRGKRNEPVNVDRIAKKLSEIKNCSLERIASQTTENARIVFGI